MRRELGAAGLGALAVLAVVGWTRAPEPQAASPKTLMPVAEQTLPVTAASYQAPAATVQAAPVRRAAAAPAPARVERTARRAPATYRDSEPAVKETRSTKKSVAIVAGGAAAGAAIGGLAGGGKGAAIGAISGGTAGLIYDRMTKNNGDKIF